MKFLRIEHRAATVFLAAAMLALLELSVFVMDRGLPLMERSLLFQMAVAVIWILLSCRLLYPRRGAGNRENHQPLRSLPVMMRARLVDNRVSGGHLGLGDGRNASVKVGDFL